MELRVTLCLDELARLELPLIPFDVVEDPAPDEACAVLQCERDGYLTCSRRSHALLCTQEEAPTG